MDQKLLFLINREWTGPVLDRVMAIVTSFALWTVPLILLGLAVLVSGGFRARAFCAVVLMSVVLSDSVAGYWLKRAVGRSRPHQTEFGVRQIKLAHPPWKGIFAPLDENISLGTSPEVGGRSFPSNHAANTASAALLAAIFYRRRGWIALIPALLVAYSRIYTGSHWPSDVLAGICLGFGVALLSLLLAEWLWRLFGKRMAPSLAVRFPSLLSCPA
jgi:undecaprenyl-diphosphatase